MYFAFQTWNGFSQLKISLESEVLNINYSLPILVKSQPLESAKCLISKEYISSIPGCDMVPKDELGGRDLVP